MISNFKMIDIHLADNQMKMSCVCETLIQCGVHVGEGQFLSRNHTVPSSVREPVSTLGFSLAHTFGSSTGVVPRKQNQDRLV